MLTEKELGVEIEKWENAQRVLEDMDYHERERHFRMNTWGVVNDCGTVACIAGSCALDRWFREQGFEAIVPQRRSNEGSRQFIFKLHGQEVTAERASHGFFRTGHNLFYDPTDWHQAIDAVRVHLRALRSVRDLGPQEQANEQPNRED